MSNETIPPNLFKANLELQLRLQRLMQENGQQWLENAARAGKDGIAESGAEIESLLKAENWQELATLPAQTFWRQFQHHVGGAQALTQVAIKNQTTFTQGLQKAIQDWQKSVTQAVGQGDAVLPFQDIFKEKRVRAKLAHFVCVPWRLPAVATTLQSAPETALHPAPIPNSYCDIVRTETTYTDARR